MYRCFLTLACLCLLSATVLADYPTDLMQEMAYGNLKNEKLLQTLKNATSRHFRPLGYKKRAKKVLFGKIHLERDERGYFVRDVYCDKIIRRRVGPGQIPVNNVMNTEHTWPQSKGSKREPARGDLHHLFPTDNPANSARGNHPFGEVVGKDATRDCAPSQRGDIIDPETGERTATYGFQPPLSHRGNVARAMFYVRAKYGYKLQRLEEAYLRKWHLEDPVDQEERDRNDAIEEAQGNRNPFIDYPELVERIADF